MVDCNYTCNLHLRWQTWCTLFGYSVGFCIPHFRGEHSGVLMILLVPEAYGTVKPLGCFLTLEQIWKGNLYLWKQRLSMLAKDTYPQNNSRLLLALPRYFTDISLVLDFWEKVSSYSTTCTGFVLGTKLYYIQDRHIQAWVFIWDLANLQKPQVNGVRNVQRNSCMDTGMSLRVKRF